MSDKPFRFRLASVLRVAELRKKLAQQEAAVADARAVAAEREARQRLDAVEIHQPAPVADLQEFARDREVGRLRAESAAAAERSREEAVIALTEARNQWLLASRRARSLEQLEDRHHAAHAMVAARAAQRALDDLVRLRRTDGAR